jgi:hypothetical protein
MLLHRRSLLARAARLAALHLLSRHCEGPGSAQHLTFSVVEPILRVNDCPLAPCTLPVRPPGAESWLAECGT